MAIAQVQGFRRLSAANPQIVQQEDPPLPPDQMRQERRERRAAQIAQGRGRRFELLDGPVPEGPYTAAAFERRPGRQVAITMAERQMRAAFDQTPTWNTEEAWRQAETVTLVGPDGEDLHEGNGQIAQARYHGPTSRQYPHTYRVLVRQDQYSLIPIHSSSGLSADTVTWEKLCVDAAWSEQSLEIPDSWAGYAIFNHDQRTATFYHRQPLIDQGAPLMRRRRRRLGIALGCLAFICAPFILAALPFVGCYCLYRKCCRRRPAAGVAV